MMNRPYSRKFTQGRPIPYFGFWLAIVGLIFFATSISAQEYTGLKEFNFSGVHGVDQQPASIVNSPYIFDAVIPSASISSYNDLAEFELREAVYGGIEYQPQPLEGDEPRSIYNSYDINISSFMISIGEKNAVGFGIRFRTITNVYGMEEEGLGKAYIADFNRHYDQSGLTPKGMLESFAHGLSDSAIKENDLTNGAYGSQFMHWVEYGANYGRVIMEDGAHFLKGGIRLKLLQGLKSSYAYLEDTEYRYDASDQTSNFSSDVEYGRSTYNSGIQTLGGDVGFVYEWRPNYEDYQYEMDGEKGLWKRDEEKYKLRAGLSLLDVGNVNFNGTTTERFETSVDYPSSSGRVLYDTLGSMIQQKGDSNGTFQMSLPTSISAQLDFRVAQQFFIGARGFWSLHGQQKKGKVHYKNEYSIIPRWDAKWYGVSVPVTYNELTKVRVGLGIRGGVFFIGTSDLLAIFGDSKINGLDYYAGFKIPIPHSSPDDRDKDGVSDDKDECPEKPGPWKLRGCPPDKDQDGIADENDKCPERPGLMGLEGCPQDTDGDGIADDRDECMRVEGIAAFNGCPDSDSDSIPDKDDNCPDLAGSKSSAGCPDEKILYAMNHENEVVAKAYPNQEGVFEFDKLPADKAHTYLIDAEDSLIEDNIKIQLQGREGPRQFFARMTESGFFKRYLPSDIKEGMSTKELNDSTRLLFALDDSGNVVGASYLNDKGVYEFRKLPADKAHRYQLEGVDPEAGNRIKIGLQGKSKTRMFPVKMDDSGYYYRFLSSDKEYVSVVESLDEGSKLLYVVDKDGNVIGASYPNEDGVYEFRKLKADKAHIYRLEGKESDDDIEIVLQGKKGQGPRRYFARMTESGRYRYLPSDKNPGLPLKKNIDMSQVVELTKKQAEVVDKAFDDLRFNFGKSTIREGSFDALNRLVDLLQDYPDWRIRLDGYTDNVGSKTRNLNLSRKRAQRVGRYLMERGIEEERIDVNYHGSADPVADNSTEEGRKKNRRVEMTIVEGDKGNGQKKGKEGEMGEDEGEGKSESESEKDK